MSNESLNKTARAARLIAEGQKPHTVFSLLKGEAKMARLDNGVHGCQQVVGGYRRAAIDDAQNLHLMIAAMTYMATSSGGCAHDITDQELNVISLAAELTASKIQHYMRLKEAGGSPGEERYVD